MIRAQAVLKYKYFDNVMTSKLEWFHSNSREPWKSAGKPLEAIRHFLPKMNQFPSSLPAHHDQREQKRKKKTTNLGN